MGDVQSQTKLYADFASGSSGAGGNLLLNRVKSVKVKDDRGTEVVKAVGVNGGAGYRRKQGGGTITLEVYREDKPQVRWRSLMNDKRIFTFTMQDDNGQVPAVGVRENFYNCTVSNVDRTADDDGNHMDEVEIKFLSSAEVS